VWEEQKKFDAEQVDLAQQILDYCDEANIIAGTQLRELRFHVQHFYIPRGSPSADST
jgi:hypothetical protein